MVAPSAIRCVGVSTLGSSAETGGWRYLGGVSAVHVGGLDLRLTARLAVSTSMTAARRLFRPARRRDLARRTVPA